VKKLLLLLIFFSSLQLNAASETQIKAVFLKKFTHLIEWPDNNRSDFTICVLNDLRFGRELRKVYTNKEFKSKTVKIVNISEKAAIPECQLLFIGKEVRGIAKLMKSTSARPMLTVSDNKAFIEDDVMITMFLNQNRFRYIINNKRAQNVNIKISYLLLKSALKVIK